MVYMVTLNFVTDLIKNILMLKRFLKILLNFRLQTGASLLLSNVATKVRLNCFCNVYCSA